MKIYDYRCRDCNNISEHFVSNSEVFEVECTGCGGVASRLPPATKTNAYALGCSIKSTRKVFDT